MTKYIRIPDPRNRPRFYAAVIRTLHAFKRLGVIDYRLHFLTYPKIAYIYPNKKRRSKK